MSSSAPVSVGPDLDTQAQDSQALEGVPGEGQAGEPALGQKMPAECRPQTQAWELFLQRQSYHVIWLEVTLLTAPLPSAGLTSYLLQVL